MNGSDFLGLDPAAAPPRGRTAWLAERMRAALADGAIAPGGRLPATRDLADELGFSRGTVVEAYRRLTEEGLLIANRGAGTVAAATPPRRARPAPSPRRTPDDAAPLHLSEGVPDLSAFPRAAWLKAEQRILSTASARELGYADPQGVPALREALAGWLARSRGLTVGAERIIVTGGATGGLSLIAQAMRLRGRDRCAIEDPSAAGTRRILEHWLVGLDPIPVDRQGLDVTALRRSSARTVLVTPAHQFPTGVVLSPERRRELIAWAEDVDGIIIEDDYDSEYRYDRAPLRALHASAPRRVLHVSSLSKVIAPALRMGWVVAPDDWHEDLVRIRWATDLGSPALPQLVLADLIASGVLERQLRRQRLRHRQRRDAAAAAIARHLPGCRIEGIAAGLHLLVLLPGEADDHAVSERAAAAGIRVTPLSAHRFSPGAPGLVIGYGAVPPAQLEEAIRLLGTLL